MITVSFDVREEDLVALASQYYEISPTVQSAGRTWRWTIALVLGTVGSLILLEEDSGSRPLGYVFVAWAVLAWALYPRWYRSALRRTAEKYGAESSYQKAFGSYTLTVSGEGLASTSPTGESKYRWDAIHRYVLTPKYLFIFLSGPSGWPIPREQVSDADIDKMIELIASHTSR